MLYIPKSLYDLHKYFDATTHKHDIKKNPLETAKVATLVKFFNVEKT